MSDSRTPPFDPNSLLQHTPGELYLPEDVACATKNWPRREVADAFAAYRSAVDVADHDTMAGMLSDGGRGGNATFGLFHDRASYRQFLTERWNELVPNYSVWHVVDGGRVVNKWREVLPGTPPGGGRYEYFGINELIYAGERQFRLMYSVPDLFGLTTVYRRWKANGQHGEYGEIYPGLGR